MKSLLENPRDDLSEAKLLSSWTSSSFATSPQADFELSSSTTPRRSQLLYFREIIPDREEGGGKAEEGRTSASVVLYRGISIIVSNIVVPILAIVAFVAIPYQIPYIQGG